MLGQSATELPLPKAHFFFVPAICYFRKSCQKTTRSYALFHNTNFGINPKGEVNHFKKWPDSSPEAA